jgi:hypothetical protein
MSLLVCDTQLAAAHSLALAGCICPSVSSTSLRGRMRGVAQWPGLLSARRLEGPVRRAEAVASPGQKMSARPYLWDCGALSTALTSGVEAEHQDTAGWDGEAGLLCRFFLKIITCGCQSHQLKTWNLPFFFFVILCTYLLPLDLDPFDNMGQFKKWTILYWEPTLALFPGFTQVLLPGTVLGTSEGIAKARNKHSLLQSISQCCMHIKSTWVAS